MVVVARVGPTTENDRGLNGAVGFDTGDVRVPGALGTLRVYANPGPIEALGLWGNGVSRNTWWASDIFAAGALVAAGLALYQEFSFPDPSLPGIVGSAKVVPEERCESGRIGLTANELTWETGSQGSNPCLSAR